MTTTAFRSRFIFALTVFLALVPLASRTVAQGPSSGTIEGRVFNPRNGEYIERARVTIDAAGLETFTDSSGQYRLTNVPPGAVNVKVFFTGLEPQTDSVVVSAGSTVQHDFNLNSGS